MAFHEPTDVEAGTVSKRTLARPAAIEKGIGTDEVADFMARRGGRVVRSASSWWHNLDRRGRVFQAFPFHLAVEPSEEEVRELFRRLPRALALRFLRAEDGGGWASVLWTRRRPYDLSSLSSKSRNQTRRGLENCQVRSLSFPELVEKGWEAHRDTAVRHGMPVPNSLGVDVRLQECAAYETWGAFVAGQLAAYLVTLTVEDGAEFVVHRSATAYLKHYPNNALVFTVVRELLARPGVATIRYGLNVTPRSAGNDHFKLNMGFEAVPVRQRIVVRRWLRPCFNAVTCKAVELLASSRWLRGDSRLTRLAGFCRAIQQSR